MTTRRRHRPAVARRPRRTTAAARSSAGRWVAARRPAPRVVDAAAGAARPDLRHLRARPGAEGLVPRPRVDRAGRLHPRLLQRHPAAVLRPRSGRRRRARTSGRRPSSRSSTRCSPALAMWLTAKLVPSSDDAAKRAAVVLRHQRARARAGRGASRSPPPRCSPADGRGTPRCSRSRPALALAGDDQLGPVRRRAARPGHAGLGARETGGRRGADRSRARRPSSIRCSCSARCWCCACGPAGCASSGPRSRPRPCGVGSGQRAVHAGRLRRLVEVLPAVAGARRRLRLGLVRARASRATRCRTTR